MVLPSLDQALELPWDGAVAKSRGIYGFDSIDPRSRSFNMIRAKLMELRRDRKWRMVGIVSATPNVGKSFISANLAAALSRDPRLQTYLLDLDLRRASLTELFGMAAAGNLLEFLGTDGRLAAPVGYRPQGESLIVLPTARGLVHSAELLAGSPAQQLFNAMRASHERNFFLVDLPPVFANDDAVTAMTKLDAYVLVAEEGTTTQREISDAVALLGEARLAGVILNKYRGGLMSEGYGVDAYYAKGYYGDAADDARG